MSEKHSISISVCVPTRNRPDMLNECLASILNQSVLPDEIIIGDDSDDNSAELVVKEMVIPNTTGLRFLRNVPKLGQSRNVQNCFEHATSDWLLLIHDDDWLLPDALAHLSAPTVGRAPDVIFGNQLIASADGAIDHEATRKLNPGCYRTSDRTGLQDDPVWSAVVGQFPNNGYLVRRTSALAVGYHNDAVRDGCDYRFGVELAISGAQFYYIDQMIAVYRKSPSSVARTAVANYTAMLDNARTIYNYRDKIPLDDVAVRKFVQGLYYRAAIWSILQRHNLKEALGFILDRRFGISFFSREMVGVVTALLVPGLREQLKMFQHKTLK